MVKKSFDLRLSGLIVPIVTPMNPGGAIDDDSLRRLTRHLVGTPGVAGICTSARIGEGPVMSFEEQVHLAREVRTVAGNAYVVSTIAPQSPEEGRAQLRALAEVGVEAVMVFPPLFLAWGKVPDDVKLHFYRELTEDSPVPVVLFQTPVKSYWMSPEVVGRIAELPAIVAMKEASFDMQLYGQIMQVLKGKGMPISMLNGNDHFVAEGALLGAEGALIGIANLFADQWARVIDMGQKGDIEGALGLQRKLSGSQDLVFAEPILDAVSRLKAVLRHEGIIESDDVRSPQMGIDEREREQLLAAYSAIKAIVA